VTLVLTVLAGAEPGRTWQCTDASTVRVGASEAAEVVLTGDNLIAPTHAALYWHEGTWRVRDLAQGAGTWRNGLGVHDEALASGDVIQCGRTQLRVEWRQTSSVALEAAHDTGAAALAVLRGAPGRLHAVLDAAVDVEVLQLLRRSGYRYECLYDGWLREVYGEAAPYLVRLRKEGRLLEQLIERGWGRRWGIFLASRERFEVVRRHLRRLHRVERADGEQVWFRIWDPLHFDGLVSLRDEAQYRELKARSITYFWESVSEHPARDTVVLKQL
jgi:hypothetical protein